MMVWVIILVVGLLGYNTFNAYTEQMEIESVEETEGMNCLYQFKTEECNPLNLSDNCAKLLDCVKKS